MTKLVFQTALLNLRASALKPKSTETIASFARKHRVLSAQSSALPGPWLPRFKGSEEILDAITRPEVRTVSLMMSAQIAKTDILLNTLAYYLHEDPSSVIFSMPTEKALDEVSRVKIDNLILDTAPLKQSITPKNDSLYLKVFNNGARLALASALSASDLAGRSARILLADEVSRYGNIAGEGSALDLLIARTSTYIDSKCIFVSTPTTEGECKITALYEAGSQHVFHATCPHCGALENLRWQQVKWEKDNSASARYECSHCNAHWDEADRHQACQQGCFIASNPGSIEHLSFHANCIASPFKPLSHFVSLFLTAKKDPEKLRSFVNLYLGEPWRPPAKNKQSWEALYER